MEVSECFLRPYSKSDHICPVLNLQGILLFLREIPNSYHSHKAPLISLWNPVYFGHRIPDLPSCYFSSLLYLRTFAFVGPLCLKCSFFCLLTKSYI